MAKIEMMADAVCGTGVLLAPFYLLYQLAMYLAS